MSDQADREAKLRAIAKKKVVYTLPGMEALEVRRDIAYRSTAGGELLMDVYYPTAAAGSGAPVVVCPLAYPDPEARVRMYGPVTSWAQLMAASGMAAVLYGASAPAEDVHAALHHLRTNAGPLGIDAGRMGIFAASGNVTVALSALMRDAQLKCAALLCGYTMDLDGSTAVADTSKQFGFADACAGKSVDDLPDDVPMLFVRAGRDQFPGLNHALDKVIARALARNLPLTLVNHGTGTHGFDLDEDSEPSRGIIRHVLAFLRLHLGALG